LPWQETGLLASSPLSSSLPDSSVTVSSIQVESAQSNSENQGNHPAERSSSEKTELSQILARESSLRYWIGWIVCIWLVVFLLSLFRGSTRTGSVLGKKCLFVDLCGLSILFSVAGFKGCSTPYWILTALYLPTLLGIAVYISYRLYRWDKRKSELDYYFQVIGFLLLLVLMFTTF
jgi:hypothetical protein